jgi:hypothetical protein
VTAVPKDALEICAAADAIHVQANPADAPVCIHGVKWSVTHIVSNPALAALREFSKATVGWYCSKAAKYPIFGITLPTA